MSEDAFDAISSGLIVTTQYVVGDPIRIYIGAGRGRIKLSDSIIIDSEIWKNELVSSLFEEWTLVKESFWFLGSPFANENILNRRYETMLKNLCIYLPPLGRARITPSCIADSDKLLVWVLDAHRYLPLFQALSWNARNPPVSCFAYLGFGFLHPTICGFCWERL